MRDLGLTDADVSRLEDIVDDRQKGSNYHFYPARKGTEHHCSECHSKVTQTMNFGEVGHAYGCERREERYHGQTGSMRPSPPNKKVATDGGERS